MSTLTLSHEQFATERRSAQDRLTERLSGVVGGFISTGNLTDLRAALENIFAEEFAKESDKEPTKAAFDSLMAGVEKALDKATPESSVEVTSLALANAVLNASAQAAADAEGLVSEWVTMDDGAVRATHRAANGQQRPAGEPFNVGGEEMPYPGFTAVDPALWINCRCSLRPAMPNEFSVELAQMRSLVAAGEEVTPYSVCIVAVPSADSPVHEIGPEEKHATLLYLGAVEDSDHVEHITNWVKQIASDGTPFTAPVTGIDHLGPGGEAKAAVWALGESDLNGMHEGVLANEQIKAWYEAADITHWPSYTPHVTIGYEPTEEQLPGEYDPDQVVTDETMDAAKPITEITFDRLAVWHGDERYEFNLGETMDKPEINEAPREAVEAADEVPVDSRVPWHGVIAPEGVRSGDGRTFAPGSLRQRNLPLPLMWQKFSGDRHNQSPTIAMIEKSARIDGLIHASGHFLSSVPETDEFIGLLSEFGRYGISVDADDVGEMEYDEEKGEVTFHDARMAGATAVQIPAFQEAYIALGPHPILDAEDAPEDDDLEPEETGEGGVDHEESLSAAALSADITPEQFVDVAPGRTEDGPGWLTHPVDTDRLRDYWVRGPGAAKIGWGVPGDFNRCRVNVAEYVKPQYLNGYCANRHYDALGVWPGQEASIADHLTDTEKSDAISLIAAGGWSAPSEFFNEPTEAECGPGEAIVIEGERVFGYIAEWGVCHIGISGVCTEAPTSAHDYGYFKTGTVNTPNGPQAIGRLTVGTGHAKADLRAAAAVAHYDNTGTMWALVNVGENERGIWFSGMLRPGISDDVIGEVMAAGRISGDWREQAGNLELVAALTVNVPGFPISKPRASVYAGVQNALVAAGVVEVAPPEPVGQVIDLAEIVRLAVRDEIEARENREKMSLIETDLNVAQMTALKSEMEN